ncbi:hypothetical protein [Phenylobacterium sp.]|jgi:hypothetical protein
MKTPEQLLAEAEEAERMAALVSYQKDKDALLQRAAELRRAAEQADRSRR